MPHVDSLRAAYAAFAAGDLPGILAPLDPQIEWHVPTVLPQGGEYHGHEGVIAFLTKLATSWNEPVVEVDAVVESGDRVIVTGRTSGERSGERVSYAFAHSWLFHDERAVSFTEYVDPAELLAEAPTAG
jgi:ketosteroid isomerase-like protein